MYKSATLISTPKIIKNYYEEEKRQTNHTGTNILKKNEKFHDIKKYIFEHLIFLSKSMRVNLQHRNFIPGLLFNVHLITSSINVTHKSFIPPRFGILNDTYSQKGVKTGVRIVAFSMSCVMFRVCCYIEIGTRVFSSVF